LTFLDFTTSHDDTVLQNQNNFVNVVLEGVFLRTKLERVRTRLSTPFYWRD